MYCSGLTMSFMFSETPREGDEIVGSEWAEMSDMYEPT